MRARRRRGSCADSRCGKGRRRRRKAVAVSVQLAASEVQGRAAWASTRSKFYCRSLQRLRMGSGFGRRGGAVRVRCGVRGLGDDRADPAALRRRALLADRGYILKTSVNPVARDRIAGNSSTRIPATAASMPSGYRWTTTGVSGNRRIARRTASKGSPRVDQNSATDARRFITQPDGVTGDETGRRAGDGQWLNGCWRWAGRARVWRRRRPPR